MPLEHIPGKTPEQLFQLSNESGLMRIGLKAGSTTENIFVNVTEDPRTKAMLYRLQIRQDLPFELISHIEEMRTSIVEQIQSSGRFELYAVMDRLDGRIRVSGIAIGARLTFTLDAPWESMEGDGEVRTYDAVVTSLEPEG